MVLRSLLPRWTWPRPLIRDKPSDPRYWIRNINEQGRQLSNTGPERRIIRFRSNFIQTLVTWYLVSYEFSRSTGQRSRSQRGITYQHQMQARISCRRSNSVKVTPEPSVTRNAMFKVIKSNTKINNSATNCSIAFKCGTEFHHVTDNTLQTFKVKRSKVKVTGSHVQFTV